MKKLLVSLGVLMLTGSIFINQYQQNNAIASSGGITGYTGSVGDGGSKCNACHGGSTPMTTGFSITSNIPASGYVPGTTYQITLAGNDATRNLFGFNMTSENSAGTAVGTWIITDSRTQLAGGQVTQVSTSTGTNNSITYQFNWTAPAAGTGTVTFYGTLNAVNGNGGTSGDQVHYGSYSVNEYVPTGTDAGISQVNYPVNQACGTTISPVVTLFNYGSTALTSVTINYTIDNGSVNTYSWTGNLSSTSSVQVTLPSVTVTAGTHSLNVYTSNPNNTTDNNSANDASSSSFTTASAMPLPFSESFEGTTFPPAGWTLIDPDVNAASNATWTRTTTAASNGSASAFLDIYNASSINGQHDALISPPIDLTQAASASLSFDEAYIYYTTPYQFSDTLKVWISTDCGLTYQSLLVKYGDSLATAPATTSAFVPTASQWKNYTLDLTPYVGNNVLIKFECVNDWENNLYLDNINVTGIITNTNDLSSQSNISIFPNPTNGNLTITNVNNIKSIQVYNSLGQLVYQTKNSTKNTIRINLSKLPEGLYFINLIDVNNNFTTQKVLKQ